MIPFDSIASNQRYPIFSIDRWHTKLEPIYSGSYNYRVNVDGFLTSSSHATKDWGYTQLYYNGIIEAVDCGMFAYSGVKNIPGQLVMTNIIQAVDRYLKIYKELEIQAPVSFHLTLIDGKHYSFGDVPHLANDPRYKIDRPIVKIPNIEIQDLDKEPPARFLKPIFEGFWRAGGYQNVKYYDKDGNYIDE